MSLDLAMLTFKHPEGAEHAFANLARIPDDADWPHELAFVEHRRRGRLVIRGTFAGHYVDIDDESDVIGRDSVVGALTGAVVGAAFGPPGFAAGLVAGASIGGLAEAGHIPELHGELFDEIRKQVPEGHSAVILFAVPPHVDAMLEAFEGAGGVPFRHSVSAGAAAALESSVGETPLVAENRWRDVADTEEAAMQAEREAAERAARTADELPY